MFLCCIVKGVSEVYSDDANKKMEKGVRCLFSFWLCFKHQICLFCVGCLIVFPLSVLFVCVYSDLLSDVCVGEWHFQSLLATAGSQTEIARRRRSESGARRAHRRLCGRGGRHVDRGLNEQRRRRAARHTSVDCRRTRCPAHAATGRHQHATHCHR